MLAVHKEFKLYCCNYNVHVLNYTSNLDITFSYCIRIKPMGLFCFQSSSENAFLLPDACNLLRWAGWCDCVLEHRAQVVPS